MRFPFQDGDRWNAIYEELSQDSGRAAAVLGASLLDALVEDLLAAFFIDAPNQTAELLKPDRPLGAFGARIRVAYCLGLVTEDQFHDLRLIQKVRNAFAHQLDGLTFDDPSIASRTRELRSARMTFSLSHLPQNSRTAYTVAIAILGNQLGLQILSARNERRRVMPGYIVHSNSTIGDADSSPESTG